MPQKRRKHTPAPAAQHPPLLRPKADMDEIIREELTGRGYDLEVHTRQVGLGGSFRTGWAR